MNNKKTRLLFLAALFVLALPLVFSDGNAWADNAATFAQTGHANMLRKVTPPTELLGPNGVHYSGVTNATGYAPCSTVDWTLGKCGTSTMYYIMDGWLGFINGGNPKPYAITTAYSCGACHTTGFTPNCSDSTQSSRVACEALGTCSVAGKYTQAACQAATPTAGVWTAKAPGVWSPDPAKAPTTDLVPSAVIDGISGSWTTAGVQCERCHDTTLNQSLPASTNYTNGVAINALCGQCHTGGHANGFMNSPHARFSGTWGQLADSTKYNSHFTLYYGGSCASCHDVHKSLVVTAQAILPWGYATDPANASVYYCSNILAKSAIGGHASSADCVAAGGTWTQQTGAVKECFDCHNGPFAPKTINHPTGANTPKGDCNVCHMPGGKHLFRINTDTTYTYKINVTGLTVGTPCGSGGNVASSHGVNKCVDATGAEIGNAIAKGIETWAGAQWNDLDMACGQCHGGGTDPLVSPPKAGVPYMPKAVLSGAAAVMHTGTAVNGSPVMPAGASIAICRAVSINKTTGSSTDVRTGSTTDVFEVGDFPASTFNGALAGKVFVDWGDGTPMAIMAIGASVQHTYANNGTYKIRKTVQDGDPAVKGSSFGISCYMEDQVTVSSLAPSGFGKFTVAAQTCKVCSNNTLKVCAADVDCGTGNTCGAGGAALAKANVYLAGTDLTTSHLSFHGGTAAGTVTLPAVANTMPIGNYAMTAFGPVGGVCYKTSAACTTPVNPTAIAVSPSTGGATADVTVYCTYQVYP